MKKSLEDIRHRYSGKSNSDGDGSTRGSPNVPASHRTPDGIESRSTSDHPTKSEDCKIPPSTDDFNQVDFNSTIIADDLGHLYLNESINLGAIFPKSTSDSSGTKDASTKAETMKMPNSSNDGQNPTGVSSMNNSKLQLTNTEPWKVDFSARRVARLFKTSPTATDSSSELPEHSNAIHQTVPTADGSIVKKGTSSKTNGESVVHPACAEPLNMPTSSSCKPPNKLISGSTRHNKTTTNQETFACKNVKSQTSSGMLNCEMRQPNENSISQHLKLSGMYSPSGKAANDRNDSKSKLIPGSLAGSDRGVALRQLTLKSLPDEDIPRCAVKIRDSHPDASSPQMSHEVFDKLMSSQLIQFSRPRADAINLKSCSEVVWKKPVDGMPSPVAIGSEDQLTSEARIEKDPSLNYGGHTNNPDEHRRNIGFPVNTGRQTPPKLETNHGGVHDLYQITSDEIETISCCDFEPIHSNFGSPGTIQESLTVLDVIPEESFPEIESQDLEVSPSDTFVEVRSASVNFSSHDRMEESLSVLEVIAEERSFPETAFQDPEVAPDTFVEVRSGASVVSCNSSTQADSNDCSECTTARESFLNALPVEELLAQSRHIAVDLYCNSMDEPEPYALPTPSDYLEHKWIPRKTDKIFLGSSGCCYDGELLDNKMNGHGRFYFAKDEYIEGKWGKNILVELIGCTLAIESSNCTISVVKTADFYLISIFEFNIVAKAVTESFKELDFNASVADLKASFLSKFKVVEILNNEWTSNLLLKEFKEALKLATDDTDIMKNATILYLLGEYANNVDAQDILQGIRRNDVFPPALQAAAENLLTEDSTCKLRNQVINRVFNISEPLPQIDISGIILKKFEYHVAHHRRCLLRKCPTDFPKLMEIIQELPARKILYVTREDVGVFHHLLSLQWATESQTSDCVQKLFGCLLEEFSWRLKRIEIGTPPCAVIPLTSPVFGHLYEGFCEIVEEIVSVSNKCRFEDMLWIDDDWNWQLKVDIEWPANEEANPQSLSKKPVLHQKSLEAQYHALHQMLVFFSPGNYLKDRIFTYEFHLLKFDPSWWLPAPNDDVPGLSAFMALEALSNDRLSWLYILDYTLSQMFKGDPRALEFINLYSPLLRGYFSFVQKSSADTHESFRALLQSVIHFFVSSVPFTKTLGQEGLDSVVLNCQIQAIRNTAHELELGSTINYFRDLIEECKRFWTHRPLLNVDDCCQSGYFAKQIQTLILNLGEVVKNSLANDAPIPNLVRYLRSLNDFLEDFKNLNFLNCWYIKWYVNDVYYDRILVKVDNKISSSLHCSYRVRDIDDFSKCVTPVPKHYIIEVVTRLIGYVTYLLNRSWSDAEKTEQTSNVERLESAGILLDAIRHSFMYLKEQHEYIDFETFLMESTEPFKRIVYESRNLDDIKSRTKIVMDSFWYVRKMDEIGIDRAVQLFAGLNDCPVPYELSDAYKLYLKSFNSYVEIYCSRAQDVSSRDESLAAVRSAITLPEPIHFSKWSSDFKSQEIPKLLAGLSAVWSVLVSKDVSRTGNFFKPHCIQILCVMRLLSVDKPETGNHLAQVLTGQGKSLILGLLSSVLAVTGHKVRVVCYNEYLSERDEMDFEEFFSQFNITDLINYGTFRDMANAFLRPLCNGENVHLRTLVRERVLHHKDWAASGSIKTESRDTVLLIDEVDVFFNDRFYGNTYDLITSIEIPGLANVQRAMWKIAQDNPHCAVEVKRLTENYIRLQISLGDSAVQEWEAFCDKPGTYSLLTYDSNGKYRIKEYTNRSLTDEHLLKMAEDAVLMASSNDLDHKFKLNEEGLVCMQDIAGEYEPGVKEQYRNTFAYFKMKGSDYLSMEGQNFGYFLLHSGKISYGRLPCEFPLIMGVSGTLKDLREHEEAEIDFYGIEEFSFLPSFQGESTLKFTESFTFVHEQQDWLNRIYLNAKKIVQCQRAVLIFFDSDVQVDLFAGEYGAKFDRVNEITSKTASRLRDVRIDDAGMPRTVTLATRVMGRGLDYKSSKIVENTGGIHVIQTFFSLDVREEIHIRGRTRRKCNRGSYELVVCREHLVRKRIIRSDAKPDFTYSDLQFVRQTWADRLGKRQADKMKKSEHDHEITMEYYGLS